MVDYIIVGAGLAGIAFAETALQRGKTVMVFDAGMNGSSAVAAGLYNPVILKRFSGLQDAQSQLNVLNIFYAKLEQKLQRQFLFPTPIWRKFHSIEEQNEWFIAADKPSLSAFLSTKLHFDVLPSIASPHGYGAVLQTGYVDTAGLLTHYRAYLVNIGSLIVEKFDYHALRLLNNKIEYKSIEARHIVFAEGFGLSSNPFFRTDELNGTKGELLIIRAPKLQLSVVVNAGLFVMPMGDDLFKIGATYEWDDKTAQRTQNGKRELIEKLEGIIDCEYEIVQHLAGIRPTTKGRKALLGTHHLHLKLHILNGLGTRGVMLAPYLSEMLYEHIETGAAIPKELDIRRFL